MRKLGNSSSIPSLDKDADHGWQNDHEVRGANRPAVQVRDRVQFGLQGEKEKAWVESQGRLGLKGSV